jgi:thiol-disulfide isomerase/thioredoxin
MKSLWISTFVLCGALVAPLFAQDKKPAEKPVVPAPAKIEPLKIGAKVDENLVLRDIDGKQMTFKDLRGKVVFIHFWSTQCPYEIVADPKTVALAERYKGKDVVCLAIDANQGEIGEIPAKDAKPADTYKDIRKHLAEKKMSFPIYVDHGNKLADIFGAQHTPHCFVIDAKGVLAYAGGLDDDPKGDKGDATKTYVRDAVDALLAGKPVAVTESKPYGCGIKRAAPRS